MAPCVLLQAGQTQRNEVSSSLISSSASLNVDGAQRMKGLVKALPFNSNREPMVAVPHHSQVFPHMS